MRVLADDISDLMRKTVVSCMNHSEPDVVLSIESHFLDSILVADSCEMKFDVGEELWLNVGRWSRLVKEYIDEEKLDLFIKQCQEIIGGESREGATTEFRFKDPIRSPKKHRWGGCLLAASFHGSFSDQPTLTFYSRTSYLGYIGMLDAAIAHVMAREIADPFGECSIENIKFIWHIASIQLHHFKAMPYVFTRPALYRRLKQGKFDRDSQPVWWNMRKWYDRIKKDYKQYGVKMIDHEKYGPFKRVKRRWLEHEGKLFKNLPPSLPVSKLDFSKAL
jgi:hypothetical protein